MFPFLRRRVRSRLASQQTSLPAPRRLAMESCEPRLMLAGDMLEAIRSVALDSNADGYVSPGDLVVVMRELAQHGARSVEAARGLRSLDANLDRIVNVQDAVRLLTHVGQHGSTRLDVRNVLRNSVHEVPEAQREKLQETFQSLNERRRDADLKPEDMIHMFDRLAHLSCVTHHSPDEALQTYLKSMAGQQARDTVREATNIGALLRSLPADPAEARELSRSWQELVDHTDHDRLDRLLDHVHDYLTNLPPRDGDTQDPGPPGDGTHDHHGDHPVDWDYPRDHWSRYRDLVEHFAAEPVSQESMRALLIGVQDLLCQDAHHFLEPLPLPVDWQPVLTEICDLEIPEELPPDVQDSLTKLHELWQPVVGSDEPLSPDALDLLLQQTDEILEPLVSAYFGVLPWDGWDDVWVDDDWTDVGDLPFDWPIADLPFDELPFDELPPGPWSEWIDTVFEDGAIDGTWFDRFLALAPTIGHDLLAWRPGPLPPYVRLR